MCSELPPAHTHIFHFCTPHIKLFQKPEGGRKCIGGQCIGGQCVLSTRGEQTGTGLEEEGTGTGQVGLGLGPLALGIDSTPPPVFLHGSSFI